MKLFFLGLDGTTFDLLDPLMQEKRMPKLEEIISRGTRAALETTIPPITPTAWVSLVTGKNPGKHGILEFLLRRSGSMQDIPINQSLRDAAAIWDILSAQGYKVIVTNMPVTYPPTPINGIMISDFLTPRGKHDFAYPEGILKEIEERFGPYRLYITEVYAPGNVDRVLDQLFDELEYKTRVTEYLLRNHPWDAFFTHIWSTDRCQHELWHLWDKSHPMSSNREIERHYDRVMQFWKAVDDAVSSMYQAAGASETLLMIASDHGFGPIHKFLCFNVWLLEEGLLVLKRNALTRLKRLMFKLGLTPELGYRLSMKLGLAKIRLAAGVTNRSSLFRIINKLMLSLEDVDWSRTLAYSKGNYGQLFINLKGREPYGTVEPGLQYERVVSSVIEKLRKLVDPATGQKLIGEIWRREELYTGPHTEEAPDISFLPADMRYKPMGTLDLSSNRFITDVYGNSGDHRMNGLFIAAGPRIKSGLKLEHARIIDLAPSMLYLLDQPIPEDMDGKVLTEMIEEEYLHSTAIRYCNVSSNDRYRADLDEQDSREVCERLKSLGYL
ncbi:MAG: alkaline phosphatase family protein [Acidobacteriota bacterium]|nr:alkaline phosphatase family protein [Blastocatellia bacterium]MDW8412689.1 alkaline phosphatase family protein [Acidobacteriota bacterium]